MNFKGGSGKEIDIHAQGELKVLGVEAELSAKPYFCGVKFPFYPDGKRFVGFGAVSSSPGSGGIYLVVVVAFFPTRQRRLAPGKVGRCKNISIYNFIHQSLPVLVKAAVSLLKQYPRLHFYYGRVLRIRVEAHDGKFVFVCLEIHIAEGFHAVDR